MPEIIDFEPSAERVLRLLNQHYSQESWDPSTAEALSVWLGLVLSWNRKMDLTAARGVDEFFDLFLADSIVLHRARRELDLTSTWLDIGSGAGAPGLGMAILDPKLRITLVEPNAKRVAFLRQVLGRIRLSDVQVVCARSDNATQTPADEVVSRATWAPDAWLQHGLPLARRRLWVMLARDPWRPPPGCAIEYDLHYQWPLTGVCRRLVALASNHGQSER